MFAPNHQDRVPKISFPTFAGLSCIVHPVTFALQMRLI
jgi:hypothetical protein